ncbi:MAG TPA: hypothetical protein DCW68_05670 [Rhodospirillaceae bacterium]|nr:MAG: hypothetical protein A2018_01985 [Alphaproteobacteria bacterium GWF2_58_20]HAU29582.1 hypothetical protein [Rhodospirillaceae bacterium]
MNRVVPAPHIDINKIIRPSQDLTFLKTRTLHRAQLPIMNIKFWIMISFLLVGRFICKAE